jgi:plastocyanin
LNLSTDELSPGSYRIELGLDLDNGDSVTEDSYFNVDAFGVNVTQKSNQESFQPGSKVTYFVNTSKTSDYEIEADDVRSYNYRTGERSEVELNLDEKFQGTSSMAVNISIPESANEGSYNGDLEISSEETTQYETITFDVDTKGVGIPKTAELQYNTDNTLEPQTKRFYEDETTYFTENDCSDVLNREDLDFESNDQSGKGCSVAILEDASRGILTSSRFENFNITWIDQTETQSWNDSKVYITKDSAFNESGDIARNKSLYEPVSLPGGLKLNITEIGPYNLEMTPLNGFSSRVIVDRSADSYFYDETDINGDGDKEDTVRALLINNSGQFTTRISFNNNFTSDNSTLVDKSGADLGGEVVYAGELRNSSRGVKRNLVFATSSENGDIDVELSEGSNVTIPVLASYPNGTPVGNQQVGVSKFIRQSSEVADSKIFNTSRASAVTDSNGVAFIKTNLPKLETRATATYEVIVTTLGAGRNPIDTFDAPEVTVSKFSKSSNAYSRVSLGKMSSYSDQNKTTNSQNLELNEGVNLVDGRFNDYESTEYRYKTVTEKIGSNCYDLNRNYQCDESLQILLYDNGFSNVEGLDVNEGIIDDDPILGQDFRQETRGVERTVQENEIFANYSAVQLSRSVGFIDTLIVFNESVDSLSMFNTDVYTDDNVYLALRGTELFSQKPLSGEATVEELSYDGKTFNSSSTISKPIDDEGFVIFNLSREDFSGSEESWEEGPIAFEGTINGTSYIKRVSIKDSEERDRKRYRESLDSEPPSTSNNWTKQGLTDVGSTDVELDASDNQSEISKVAYKKNPGNFYNVTVKNGYYYLNGTKQKKIDLERGVNYTFNLTSSVEGHPFHISTSSVGGNFSNIITEGVSVTNPYNDNQFAAETGKLYYRPAEKAKSTLYYQCGLHNNMGAELSILDRANYQVVNGNLANVGISSSGNNTLQYFAIDKFGNREYVQKEFVGILDNSAPSASIAKNVTDPVTGETIQFDASGSTDSDGSVEEYSWDLDNDGTYGDADGTAEATKKFSTDGQKSVSVKVTDNDGLTSEKNLSFSVGNQPPNPSFTVSKNNLEVSVNATDSSDPDGTISRYEWDWTDDGSYEDTGATQTHTYSGAGTYDLRVRVEDDDGATDTKTKTVEVSDVNNVDITIDNVGSSAWEVTSVSGNKSEVASIGKENPDIKLQNNTRYTITNNGYSSHPSEIFNSTGNPLLSQSGSGTFEDDSEVNWVDNGGTLKFTVTQNLYAELNGYVCTVHSSMEGAIIQ